MLGAGIVTTASDDPHECLSGDTNQCCIDEANELHQLDQSRGAGTQTTNGYTLLFIQDDLVNDGTATGLCVTKALAVNNNTHQASDGYIEWATSYWNQTNAFGNVPNSSANKDNAIIH